jgi:hypothetical protein
MAIEPSFSPDRDCSVTLGAHRDFIVTFDR